MTQKLDALDNVDFNLSSKHSVEYAKCRAAINKFVYDTYKDNAAGGKNYKSFAKQKVIKFFNGKISWTDNKKFVEFPDGSKARY
jgi:hypothetical protein